jgi:hypothetical protein
VKAGYVVAVSFVDNNEVLYLEHLEPGVDYLYRPDAAVAVGRADALVAVSRARD